MEEKGSDNIIGNTLIRSDNLFRVFKWSDWVKDLTEWNWLHPAHRLE